MKPATATSGVAARTYDHLQRQRDTKSGVVRLYWRHPHLPKPVKCEGAEGSPQFDAQYERLNTELAAWREQKIANAIAVPQPAKAIRYLPGTIGAVIIHYEASKKFERLAPGTKKAYRSAFKLTREHLGGAVLVHLDERNMRTYLTKIERSNGPARALMQQVVLSILWRFSKGLTECRHKGKANPAREIEREYRVAKPHAPWPDNIQDRFLDGAPDYLRHAFYLALYTGQRRSDLVRMKKSHFDPRTGVLLVEAQVKTGARVPLKVHKRLLPMLREMLAHDSEYLLLNAKGEPWSGMGSGLTHAFRDRLRKLGIAARKYPLHGLRKSAACAVAEAGATVPQMMAIFGWSNPEQAMHYIRDANKTQLVADGMELWERADERKLRLVKAG